MTNGTDNPNAANNDDGRTVNHNYAPGTTVYNTFPGGNRGSGNSNRNDDGDQRRPAQSRGFYDNDRPSNPYPAPSGNGRTALGLAAIGGLVLLAAIAFGNGIGCTGTCATKANADIEMARLDATAQRARIDADAAAARELARTTAANEAKRIDADRDVSLDRIAADKQVGIARETTRRAQTNADANARAGFGNDDETTKQFAVLPRADIRIKEDGPNVSVERSGVTPGCCGSRVSAPAASCCGSGSGRAVLPNLPACNASMTDVPKPYGEGWVAGINPNNNRCTWVHAGKVPVIPG